MMKYGIEAYQLPDGFWSVRNVTKHGIVSFPFIVAPTARECIGTANACDIGVDRLRYADGRTEEL